MARRLVFLVLTTAVVGVFLAGCAPAAGPADPIPTSRIIARCEAALDEFTSEGNRPPQRVCKEENGRIRAFYGEKLSSEIKAEDTIVVSTSVRRRLERNPMIDVFTGETVARPAGRTRLCFVTYPALLPQAMLGYPNYDKAAFDLFHESRPWSYHPSAVFDSALKGTNWVCSNEFSVGEFPEKASFVIHIPSRDILALGQGSVDVMTYGVRMILVPDRFLRGFTIESFMENYKTFPTIFFLRQPIR